MVYMAPYPSMVLHDLAVSWPAWPTKDELACKAELMMASGVGNCRVAVILANSSVVDDPKVTPFHVI